MDPLKVREQAPVYIEVPTPVPALTPEQLRSPPSMIFPPVPGPMAACQIRIDFLLVDPTQVYVYPVPAFCAQGVELALVSVLMALLRPAR